jgi:DNA primase
MANYGNNFTDELRARLSIVDIVGRVVPLVKKGGRLWGCCPFHNEKTPSFTVDESRGRYKCFGCGESGDIISFTMKTQNMEFKQAIADLAQIAGIKMPDYKPKSAEQVQREETYISLYETATNLFAEKLFSPDGEFALNYLRNRGFDDATIKKYRLGYAPKNNLLSARFSNTPFNILESTGLVRRGDYGNYDFFRHRLQFPITNSSGQVIAFSGRSLDGSEPKYINTGETELFHKGKTVFGLSFARDAIHKNNFTIVVEGQIDAIKMQTNGFGNTVAPLGTALTEDHLAILCKLNRNIRFCFDGDGAGQKAAARALGLIIPFMRNDSDIKFAFMPEKSDPDDILKQANGSQKMKSILESAEPLVDFLWNLANKNYLTTTPGGRTQAEQFLKKEIEKITDINLQNEFKKEYDGRKFNQWHKWKKSSVVNRQSSVVIPNIDDITSNTLSAIVNNYPELAERHGEFLSTLNIDFNNTINSNLSISDAEKFIVSIKLKKYLEKLNIDKKELTIQILSGDESVKATLMSIDSEIKKSNERLKKLSEI